MADERRQPDCRQISLLRFFHPNAIRFDSLDARYVQLTRVLRTCIRVFFRGASRHVLVAEDSGGDQIAAVPPAVASAVALSVRVGVRDQYASEHLWNARHMARLASERESALLAAGFRGIDRELRAYVVAAILSSVAFLEAYANGVWQDIADMDPEQLPNDYRFASIPITAAARMRTLWRAKRLEHGLGVIDKFQVALTCVDQPQIEMGSEPGQTVQVMIRLRNDLVHFKPETNWTDETHDLELALKPRIGTSPLTDSQPWFPNHVLIAKCANVAYEAVRKFAELWQQRMGIGWNAADLTALNGDQIETP